MTRVLQLDDVDLAELATWIDNRDYCSAYLDPATGEVYPAFEGEVLGADGEPIDLDDVDWRPIGGSSSREAYQDMEDFADAVGDPAVSGQLRTALGGKGAFRRFRDQMYRQPEEISRAWQRYRDLRATIRAVQWLQDEQLVVEAEATARVEQLAEASRQTLDQVHAVPGSHPGTGDRSAPSRDSGRRPRRTVIDGS